MALTLFIFYALLQKGLLTLGPVTTVASQLRYLASTPASDFLQHTRPVCSWSDTHSFLTPLARSARLPIPATVPTAERASLALVSSTAHPAQSTEFLCVPHCVYLCASGSLRAAVLFQRVLGLKSYNPEPRVLESTSESTCLCPSCLLSPPSTRESCEGPLSTSSAKRETESPCIFSLKFHKPKKDRLIHEEKD